MDELIRQAIDISRGIWQRRWLGLGVAWLAGILGAVALFKMPDRYEASARVHVDTQSVLRPLMSGLAVEPNIDQMVNILSRTLISRPNIEKLIRMTDMDLSASSPREHERTVDSLMSKIRIRGGGRENLYTLSYRDSRPENAKKVVQSMLSIFVESGLGDKRQDTVQARRFIEEQIRIYEQRLTDAENRRKDFKLKYMGIMGSGGRDYFGRLTSVKEQLVQAQTELHAAEQSRDALKREMTGEDPVFLPEAGTSAPTSEPGIVPELDARIESMKKALDELLRRYTEKHPDVIGTRRVIAELEQQRKKEIAARRKASPTGLSSSSLDKNPVYQQLKFAYAEAEAKVAALRARVDAYQAEYERLHAAQQNIPRIEAELAQLDRDYAIQKRNYDNLVQRRESAAMSSEMDAAGSAAFRIIDPPRVSSTPVEPNRLLLLPLLLVAALGAGVFASFLWSQIRPMIHDGRGLRAISGRPLLGSISLVPDENLVARDRRMLTAFLGSLATLVAFYGASVALVLWNSRTAV
jgi:polysaccharide chain length determinant protein (PEP-CTERM system associated)